MIISNIIFLLIRILKSSNIHKQKFILLEQKDRITGLLINNVDKNDSSNRKTWFIVIIELLKNARLFDTSSSKLYNPFRQE